jgi:methionyl-tRNA formyltransferase
MKVIILSTSAYGTTGHHLPVLHRCKDIEIAMVVVSEGQVSNRKKQYLKRLRKILKIGIRGAMNGVRMRKWYTEDVNKYCKIENAEEYCRSNNIPFKRVPSTNSNETVELFRQAGADVGLSLGNGYISGKVFKIPKWGMLNTHHEVLPQYQNAQSIIWQLYNGSSETGYTIHKIDKHIDTGEILLQEKLPIVFRDTLEDTVAFNYARLFDASAEGLVRVLRDFEHYFSAAKPQGKGTSYTTPSYMQFLKIKKQIEKLKKQQTGK